MPERLDKVVIALEGGPITITWADRQAVIEELTTQHRDRPNSHPHVRQAICQAFEDVGATRAVTLTFEQKAHLGAALDWRGAYTEPTPGLLELRNALEDDVQNELRKRRTPRN